ncbi:MAG: isomerizing glutamine--fructose-6-phosphate transaminase, partial [Chlamydiota bacterium]
MCGIFGYIGKKEPLQTCLEGLKLLEYRGYDSAGLAGLHSEGLFFCKEVGKISQLEKKLSFHKIPLTVAISHTRWATHGEPSEKNAHPHLDMKQSLALVHNGIIENHAPLRKKLLEEGFQFISETDTEVIAQLIAYYYTNDLVDAVHKTLQKLKGAFAIALIHKDYPNHILAAARESPLVLGYNEQKTEILLSSDPNAFLDQDLSISYLKNDEIALLSPSSIEVFNHKKQKIEKSKEFLTTQNYKPTKEGFPHFMLKEIFDQPKAIQNAILSHPFENFGLNPLLAFLPQVDRIFLVACGTSWHAGCYAATLIEDKLQIPTRCEIASELRFKIPVFSKNTLVIAIS